MSLVINCSEVSYRLECCRLSLGGKYDVWQGLDTTSFSLTSLLPGYAHQTDANASLVV